MNTTAQTFAGTHAQPATHKSEELAAAMSLINRECAGILDIEVVVSVYNEQRDLRPSIELLHAFLRASFGPSAIITIADNASTNLT